MDMMRFRKIETEIPEAEDQPEYESAEESPSDEE